MHKTILILLIIILDIVLVLGFNLLSVLLFNWRNGGGVLPQLILFGIIVSSNKFLYHRFKA